MIQKLGVNLVVRHDINVDCAGHNGDQAEEEEEYLPAGDCATGDSLYGC